MVTGISLRDVREDDLPIFYRHQLDPVATSMAVFPPRGFDAFMAHWTKIFADDTIESKTIVFQNQVAGNLVCWEQDGTRKVGYWLGKEFWGQGIATAALSELLEVNGVRPLYAARRPAERRLTPGPGKMWFRDCG